MGRYMGVGKETAYGTPVAATAFFLLDGMPSHALDAPIQRVQNPSGFGDIINYPGQRQAKLAANVLATPAELGHLLQMLLGAPATSGSGPYTHVFTPKSDVPSYTVEFKAGAGFSQFPGAKLNRLSFSHSTDGALKVSLDGLAQDRVTGGSEQSPSYPTDVYLASTLGITLGGANISCEVEELSVDVGFGKEGDACFGSQTIGGVDIADGGEVTANLTYRVELAPGVDPVAALANYKAGTATALVLNWVRSAGADELKIELPNAVYTADPMVVTNDALGWARVSLQLRATGADASFFKATLINSTSSY